MIRQGLPFPEGTWQRFGESHDIFTESGETNTKNYFSFLIVYLIKPVFQKTLINLICLIHLTLNNCHVPYTGLGPRDITRIRQAGHPLTRNNNDRVYSFVIGIKRRNIR